MGHHDERLDPASGPGRRAPDRRRGSRGALGGYVLEAGLSASGAALDWLERLTGRPAEVLLTEAAASPPGANGVVALPWLHGARAPWWQPDAHAGVRRSHQCARPRRARARGGRSGRVRRVALSRAHRARRDELVIAGGGAKGTLWREVLAATTGHPLVRREIDEAASVGARVVVAEAVGAPVDLEVLNPVIARDEPDPELVDRYQEARRESDAWARRRPRSHRAVR